MKKKLMRPLLSLVLLFSSIGLANAQYFTVNDGDLMLGFRKSGSSDVVVNIGSVSTLLAMAPGTTNPIGNFSGSQLSAVYTSFASLQVSVFGAFNAPSWSGYAANTYWVSRTNSGAPPRQSSNVQENTQVQILSVANGANTISSGLGTTNAQNNSVYVKETHSDLNALTAFIGDPVIDEYYGDFQGTLPYTVERTTPTIFTSASRLDFYQSVPLGKVDPTTGLTNGPAYFVGYFLFNPSGTMTFTRASATASPPPAPVLSITRAGNVSTISFGTTNAATYTLYYTNSAGLTTSVTNWPSLPTTISGDGSAHSFMDTTTDPNRIYRVGVH
jgi:hypothetical protein